MMHLGNGDMENTLTPLVGQQKVHPSCKNYPVNQWIKVNTNEEKNESVNSGLPIPVTAGLNHFCSGNTLS